MKYIIDGFWLNMKEIARLTNETTCAEGLAKIREVEYTSSSISYATNSIYIRLYDSSEKEVGYFMVNPSWRIIQDKQMIQSSDAYPYHSRFQNDEIDKESQEFEKWCSRTDFMRNDRLRSISINDIGDLELRWSCGTIMHSQILDDSDYGYYFYDIQSEMMYEFWFSRCISEIYRRRDRNSKSGNSEA